MVFEPVLIILIVIAIGFIAAKFIRFDLEGLSNLLLYVTGACLAFSSIYSQSFIFSEFFLIALGAIIVVLGCGLLTKAYLILSKSKSTGIILSGMFPNTGYIGFPIALFAFGELGLNKAILYNLTTTILMFTIGIYLVGKKDGKGWKEVFKLPLIYAAILGILFNIYTIPIPNYLFQAIKLIGDATIPLALVVLGAKLATMKVVLIRQPFIISLLRIFGGLLIALLFVNLIGLSGITAKIVILLSAMPAAVNSYVLNQKYEQDPDLAASAVFLSTLISFASIALILSYI